MTNVTKIEFEEFRKIINDPTIATERRDVFEESRKIIAPLQTDEVALDLADILEAAGIEIPEDTAVTATASIDSDGGLCVHVSVEVRRAG